MSQTKAAPMQVTMGNASQTTELPASKRCNNCCSWCILMSCAIPECLTCCACYGCCGTCRAPDCVFRLLHENEPDIKPEEKCMFNSVSHMQVFNNGCKAFGLCCGFCCGYCGSVHAREIIAKK